MWYRYWGWNGNWGFPHPWFGWILPFVIFDLILKALALWRSARNGQKWWFFFLLIVNSLGILPGIYLLTHPTTPTITKPIRKASRRK